MISDGAAVYGVPLNVNAISVEFGPYLVGHANPLAVCRRRIERSTGHVVNGFWELQYGLLIGNWTGLMRMPHKIHRT
jgi:hypothetical protein